MISSAYADFCPALTFRFPLMNRLSSSRSSWIRLHAVAATVSSALLGAIAQTPPAAIAQSLSPCPEAEVGEYWLRVEATTPDERSRLNQVLPAGATINRCQYQGVAVIQVGSFTNEELARSWAEYLATIEGFETAIAQPTDTVSPDSERSTQPTQPDASLAVDSASQEDSPRSSATSSDGQTYEPVVLERGYAVLVRYFNRPELAIQLQAQLNTPVGLAVYQQQPYLLAFYSSDVAAAGQVLQGLSGQFSVMIVDSRQVVLLSPTVSVDAD